MKISTSIEFFLGNSSTQTNKTKQKFIKLYYLDSWMQIVQFDEQKFSKMYYIQMIQFDELLFSLFRLICLVYANFLTTQITINIFQIKFTIELSSAFLVYNPYHATLGENQTKFSFLIP